MTSLKLLGSYNIWARFAPGFLFVFALYFLLGYDIEKLESNNVVFKLLLVVLSVISGFTSACLIKFVEQRLWKKFGNPTILYLKWHKKEIYKELSVKHKGDEEIIRQILRITRKDPKLFWKNIYYGFFRNSILLSLTCLSFSWQTQYFYYNLVVFILIISMTFITSHYYAHQIVESYQEIRLENKIT